MLHTTSGTTSRRAPTGILSCRHLVDLGSEEVGRTFRPHRHTPTSDDRRDEFPHPSSPNAMEHRSVKLYPDGNLDTHTCPTISPSRTTPPPTTFCPRGCAAEQSHVSCSPPSLRVGVCSQVEPTEVEGVSQMMQPFLTTSHGVLYDADCLHVLKRMKSEVIDTVFADPPFNIGKDYKNGYNDMVDRDAYLAWCKIWIHECCRVLKPGGAFFLYATPELAIQFAPIMEEKLNFRHWIALTMKGTYPRGKKLYPAHYALLYYTRGTPRVFNKVRLPIEKCRHCGKEIRDYGGHRNKMNAQGVNLSDFWTDTSPNRHATYKVRPGVNELKLMIPERAILISTQPCDIVFDPFGGGGSTYQAAEKLHRYWIGVELHDSVHIKNRLQENYSLFPVEHEHFEFEDLFDHEDKQDPVLRGVERKDLSARAGTSVS